MRQCHLTRICIPKNLFLVLQLLIMFRNFKKKKKEFVVSCDKDDKIRVTRFPKTFIIEAFCFGHTELKKKKLESLLLYFFLEDPDRVSVFLVLCCYCLCTLLCAASVCVNGFLLFPP